MRFCPKGDFQKGSCGHAYDMGSSRLCVPVIEVHVNGQSARGLVDTGCTTTMIRERLAGEGKGRSIVAAFDGREVKCRGMKKVRLEIGEEKMDREVTVVETMVDGLDVVIGMDVIQLLGGLKISGNKVQFGNICAVGYLGRKPDIVDKDFEAYFDGDHWEVKYFWNENGEPKLRNKVSEYKSAMEPKKRQAYADEVKRWIQEGVLVPWEGEVDGVLPLLAVEQVNKNKVRPVLDFRELNRYVSCHTGDEAMDVCRDKLREWRQIEGEGKIVDLKAAYLQIRVTEELWKHQLVKFEGKVYALTRVGFGLS